MRKKLTVIVLVDELTVNKWINHIVQYLSESEAYKIVAFVVNGKVKHTDSSPAYLFLRKVDRLMSRGKFDPFKRESIMPNGSQVFRLDQRNVNGCGMEVSDIEALNQLQPDLALALGETKVPPALLEIPRFGVWTLNHGDVTKNHGGPPGFWEVINKDPMTAVTLQMLRDDIDRSPVIGKAFIKTFDTSFNRNHAALCWAGVELLKKKLDTLAKGGPELYSLLNEKTDGPVFYKSRTLRNPRGLPSILIGIRMLLRGLNRKLGYMLFFQQWTIGYSTNGTREKSGIDPSLARYKFLKPPKNHTWADPFLIKEAGELFLFAEQRVGERPGEIVCFQYDNEKAEFNNVKTVLKEKYHLSYPFVFQYNGKYYMLPESAEKKQIVLYEAEAFPYKWKKKRVLLDGKAAYDPTLHFFEGNWYMFTTVKWNDGISANELLFIFYADDPVNGKWHYHPQNPIKHDVRGSRPAGKILEHKGKLYRPAQISALKYGYGIQFYEITRLNSEEYEEKPVTTIEPTWQNNLLATHTFNTLDGLSVIDVQYRTSKLI